MLLKNTLKTTAAVLRTWTAFSGSSCGNVTPGRLYSNLTGSHAVRSHENFSNVSVRQYARAVRRKPEASELLTGLSSSLKTEFQSQLQDLSPSMLKHEYASVPLADTVDDVVKKLLSLELASHLTSTIIYAQSEKLRLKKEQLIAKVQRDEHDRSSTEVKVAILTANIRNFQEHLQKHPKDKANKRWMLMSIDQRNKKLKVLRRTHYEAFEKVCQELGISYTFPPEYYRRATRRWLAKKALCIKGKLSKYYYEAVSELMASLDSNPPVIAGGLGFLCPIALGCYTANKYGENACLACVPGGMAAMRTHMRLTYGIQGTVCNDALMTCCCGIFETCRMAREIRVRNGEA
ncbi:hypothetical protein NFI96_022314 [Prochilodus magdalenae]|nr:hypothetical protein NFI96_022314 [Prochilodus magdalenae]